MFLSVTMLRQWCVLRRAVCLPLASAVLLPLAGHAAAASPPVPDFGAPIDGYASYEGQTSCALTPSPGVVALQQLITSAYPVGAAGYLLRPCGSGGQSEHKDGRAWDWIVNATDPSQRAAADEALAWLTAPDRYGNPHALIRRLGIMYIVWNGQIFKAYSSSPGWSPYTGSSPHTDHVHFSLNFAGARQSSSWGWRSAAPTPGLVSDPATLEVAVRPVNGSPVFRRASSTGTLDAGTPLGGQVVGGVSLVRTAQGRSVVAARGTDDQLYVNDRPAGQAWTGWRPLGGILTTRPVLAGRPDGGLDAAVRGTDGSVYVRSATPDGAWSAWTSIGGAVASGAGPALVWTGDRLELVVGGTDRQLWRRTRTGGSWGPWSPLGGATRGDVTATAAPDAGVLLSVRGTDDAGYVRTVSRLGDSGWLTLGGQLSSAPSVAFTPDGRRSDVVAQGTDGRLYRNSAEGGQWSGWRGVS